MLARQEGDQIRHRECVPLDRVNHRAVVRFDSRYQRAGEIDILRDVAGWCAVGDVNRECNRMRKDEAHEVIKLSLLDDFYCNLPAGVSSANNRIGGGCLDREIVQFVCQALPGGRCRRTRSLR